MHLGESSFAEPRVSHQHQDVSRRADGAWRTPLVVAVVVATAGAIGFTFGAFATDAPDPQSPASSGWMQVAPLAGAPPGPSAPDPAALFQTFDQNQNNRLEVSEARAFYDWVEANIGYRWDDENATPEDARPVGDGRPGRDYQQTPQETLQERLGDCEDQNGLELAFYAYWNVPAYLAYVNARVNTTYDHVVAIVYAGGTLEDFRSLLGSAPYYEAKGRPGVGDGFYFIVDNTYSDEFAQVSGGLAEGKFAIHHTASYEDLFGSAWTPVGH